VKTARAGLALAGFLLGARPAPGGQAPAPSPAPPPVFRAGLDLVRVDVVVTDGEGRPVSGLVATDFALLDEGAPQPIEEFEAIAPPAPGSDAGAGPYAAPVPSGPTISRAFVIVFDESHLTPMEVTTARGAVERFLEAAAKPMDRLVLAGSSTGRSWSLRLDREGREALPRLLDELRGRDNASACGISDTEAYRIHRLRDAALRDAVTERLMRCGALGRPSAWAGPDAGRGIVESWAFEASARAEAAQKATLAALVQALGLVAEDRARPVVFLVSGGFYEDATAPEHRAVREAAQRVNTAVHFADVRGSRDVPVKSAAAKGVPDSDEASRRGVERALDGLGSEGLAADSGGEVVRGDLEAGMRRIAERSQTYYVLGYPPPSAGNGARFRRITVTMKRPGLVVRARRGYFPGALAARQPPAAAPRAPAEAWLAAVEDYRRGERAAAVGLVAAWPARRLRQAVDAPATRLEAAVMLHTDTALFGPEASVAAGSEAHLEIARSLVHLLERRPAGPSFARRWYLAVGYEQLRRWNSAGAKRFFREGLGRDARDAELRLGLGTVAELEASDPSRDLRAGDAARLGRTEDYLAQRSGERSDLEMAEGEYRRALDSAPELAEARLRRGRVLVRLGRTDEGRAEIQWVLAHTQDTGLLYLARLFEGRLDEDAGRLEAAAASYRAAVGLDPLRQTGQLALGDALGRLGDRSGAVEAWRAAASATGRDDDAWWAYRFGRPAAGLFETLRQEATR
jgi:VWFA-related protein